MRLRVFCRMMFYSLWSKSRATERPMFVYWHLHTSAANVVDLDFNEI